MPLEISGGERKICLLQILFSKPNLLLLDEPLTSLDKKIDSNTTLRIYNAVTTGLFALNLVTHSPEEANIFAKQSIYPKPERSQTYALNPTSYAQHNIMG